MLIPGLNQAQVNGEIDRQRTGTRERFIRQFGPAALTNVGMIDANVLPTDDVPTNADETV